MFNDLTLTRTHSLSTKRPGFLTGSFITIVKADKYNSYTYQLEEKSYEIRRDNYVL